MRARTNTHREEIDGLPSIRQNGIKHVGELVAKPTVSIDRTKIAYIAREFAQCPFPHSNAKDLSQIERRDGDFQLRIIADPKYGMPHGPIAKLLVVWITTAAKEAKTPEIDLGDSISSFLSAIGFNISTGGGKRSDLVRVRDQLIRLLNCVISFDYEGEGSVDAWRKMLVAEEAVLWWDVNKPKHTRYLFSSKIVLSDRFHRAIQEHAVPINIGIAAKLKRSPLALDIFVWASYRLARLKPGEEVFVSYGDLHEQFGSEISDYYNFRTKLNTALRVLKNVWSDAPLYCDKRAFRLVGIPQNAWPVLPLVQSRNLARKSDDDPFYIPVRSLLQLEDEAEGWSVHALRQLWIAWCKGKGEVPQKPAAHFRAFIRAHKKRNGNGR